ncbi:MAG: APC family permease [Deltaproteobacteria bacterium]|nr:APC family permease [Deltaproteobacteria bacterium]MBV8454703.1 APC family permease [Deltaproteobacteria bacterium]
MESDSNSNERRRNESNRSLEKRTQEVPASNKRTLTEILIGRARNIRDPEVFHNISLIAFLAWVGLGSDGLSSSCYGPEEAFLALGPHQYLAVFLALLTALTVFIISASYMQTIEQFPTGGGGYVVASKLLGPNPGLISGCALVIDYVLTISISIASGADAIFSFLPVQWLPAKFWICILVVLLLVGMNLRGVKESVLTLLPIFLAFVVMHVWLITYALVDRAPQLPGVLHQAMSQIHREGGSLGFLALLVIFLRAYSLGGGTYTGIEATSNGLSILREPRAVTGKRTMVYMAVSLAFVAGGILFGYLVFNVEPQTGKTLNAVLFEKMSAGWRIFGFNFGAPIVTFTLITEGALLFVAAQTGFVDGPRVLASMAHDRWLPRRFSNLSGRLVTQDGVLAMGLAAAATLVGTRARVDALVVLYAINVFITFTLSQLGMTVHWWQARSQEPGWRRKLAVNGIGCTFTALILMVTVTLKFYEGGWVTVLMTGGLVVVCYLVRRHYIEVGKAVEQLEVDILPEIYAAAEKQPPARDPQAPTAVLLVGGFNGLGLATLTAIPRLFNGQFRNLVFIGVGEVDSALLKGPEEVQALEQSVADDLLEYCRLAADLGFHAELRSAIGLDVVLELRRLSLEVANEFPHSVFFAGKLIFANEIEGYISRFLHNHTAMDLQNWLQLQGLSLVILPVRVFMPRAKFSPSQPQPAATHHIVAMQK